jgi:hypothetical protein
MEKVRLLSLWFVIVSVTGDVYLKNELTYASRDNYKQTLFFFIRLASGDILLSLSLSLSLSLYSHVDGAIQSPSDGYNYPNSVVEFLEDLVSATLLSDETLPPSTQ